jgi:CBS-domain-containing membrane protein
MSELENPLLALTAGDLMSRDVKTIGADMPLREAALTLARWEVHGAPVVDDRGQCIGVLSVSDLARWAAGAGQAQSRLPQTCSFQGKCREPGGRETTLCRLPEGICPLQRLREMADGQLALGCVEPNSVPTDWQMVELESLPGDSVRDFMTTIVIATEPETPVPELARLMLEQQIHRLLVLDAQRRPVGVVAVNDLLQVLAHPELATTGEQ